MGTLNILGAKVYNLGTQATNYTATSSATAIASIVTIDSLPGVARKLRDQTKLADTIELTSPSRRAKVSDTKLTVFIPDSAYAPQDTTATSNYRIDFPTDASTSTSSVTYLQCYLPASAIYADEPKPGNETSELQATLTISHSARPTYGTAAY